MFLLFLTLFGLLSFQSEQAATKPSPVSPENTIFAFDMHGVFMEQKFSELIPSLIKKYKLAAIGLANPANWANRHKVGEVFFADLQKKHPNLKGLAAHFEEFMLNQKFMLDTVEIIKELNQKGYKLYLLSNCAQETHAKLRIKFPAIYDLFHGEYLPGKNNGYNHKPQPSFFREFITHVDSQGHGSKQIIFIDDKSSNIAAAGKFKNITAVLFDSAKQLKQTIQKLELGLAVS